MHQHEVQRQNSHLCLSERIAAIHSNYLARTRSNCSWMMDYMCYISPYFNDLAASLKVVSTKILIFWLSANRA